MSFLSSDVYIRRHYDQSITWPHDHDLHILSFLSSLPNFFLLLLHFLLPSTPISTPCPSFNSTTVRGWCRVGITDEHRGGLGSLSRRYSAGGQILSHNSHLRGSQRQSSQVSTGSVASTLLTSFSDVMAFFSTIMLLVLILAFHQLRIMLVSITLTVCLLTVNHFYFLLNSTKLNLIVYKLCLFDLWLASHSLITKLYATVFSHFPYF